MNVIILMNKFTRIQICINGSKVLPSQVEQFPLTIEVFWEQNGALLQFLRVVVFHVKVLNYWRFTI